MLIPFLSGGENITPEVTEQSSIIDSIMTALVGKVTEANATPETILEGYKAWVNGELIEGTYQPVDGVPLSDVFGYTNFSYGTFTPTAYEYLSNISIEHNLGVVPKVFFIFNKTESTESDVVNAIVSIGMNDGTMIGAEILGNKYGYKITPEMTTTTFTGQHGYTDMETLYLGPYYWIAMA